MLDRPVAHSRSRRRLRPAQEHGEAVANFDEWCQVDQAPDLDLARAIAHTRMRARTHVHSRAHKAGTLITRRPRTRAHTHARTHTHTTVRCRAKLGQMLSGSASSRRGSAWCGAHCSPHWHASSVHGHLLGNSVAAASDAAKPPYDRKSFRCMRRTHESPAGRAHPAAPDLFGAAQADATKGQVEPRQRQQMKRKQTNKR